MVVNLAGRIHRLAWAHPHSIMACKLTAAVSIGIPVSERQQLLREATRFETSEYFQTVVMGKKELVAPGFGRNQGIPAQNQSELDHSAEVDGLATPDQMAGCVMDPRSSPNLLRHWRSAGHPDSGGVC